MNNIVLLVVFFGLIYFMMIRPQQKQQKKRKEMLEGLRKGDQIVTIGGIHGKLTALREDNVVITIADGVDITILKSAVGQVIDETEDEDEVEDIELDTSEKE